MIDNAHQSLSVVVPAYNERENVPVLYERLRAVLDNTSLEWELIFSVDPCTDGTEDVILAIRERDPRVKMIQFSRRFGQPMATIAGLEASTGDAVVVIDCDLQDPPELIEELVQRWQQGFDVVYAQRRQRGDETKLKRIVSWIGYRVIRRVADVEIPPNTGDFRLMSRRVVQNVVDLPEGHGFLRGLVGFVGFKQTAVIYDRSNRNSGRGNYSRLTGSLLIGMNGLIGFSRYPLQLISLLGMGLALAALLLALAYGACKIAGVHFPIGNPTIVVLLSLFSGVQLLSLGVIGEYVGRIYDEVRRRPRYIVDQSFGVERIKSPKGTD